MKQQIKKIIRALGLSKVADDMRFRYLLQKNKEHNNTFLELHKDEPFPPPYMIYETFRLDYKFYYEDGLETAEWIKQITSPFFDKKPDAILDWGCGPGRVIRHLPRIFGADCEYFGTDYNEKYVTWCNQNLKGITFKKNELYPPLLFDNNSMDLVYGISIFTHLSENAHYQWIDELTRVLKKDGLLLITTHGEVTKMNLLPAEIEKYNSENVVIRSGGAEGHRVFTAYHPVKFMHKLFYGKLQLIKHTPGTIINGRPQQDVWILKKI